MVDLRCILRIPQPHSVMRVWGNPWQSLWIQDIIV